MTLDYVNYGIFRVMGDAGFKPSAVYSNTSPEASLT